MTYFLFLLGLYYFAVIVSFFLHRYFSQFIARDFRYNRCLNIKRRCAIGYNYFIMISGGLMMNWMGDNSYYFEDNMWSLSIIISFAIILLWYFYILVELEVPKKFHNNKKWKR